MPQHSSPDLEHHHQQRTHIMVSNTKHIQTTPMDATRRTQSVPIHPSTYSLTLFNQLPKASKNTHQTSICQGRDVINIKPTMANSTQTYIYRSYTPTQFPCPSTQGSQPSTVITTQPAPASLTKTVPKVVKPILLHHPRPFHSA